MQISNLNLRKTNGVIRAEAKVSWETLERSPFTLFVDSYDKNEDLLSPDPNALLIACILSAWHSGEPRIKIDSSLCPVLTSNIKAALGVIKSWYPDDFGPIPVIESTQGYIAHAPLRHSALSLMSCGIDSLATLRIKKLQLPSNHPSSIQAVIVVTFDKNEDCSKEILLEESKGRMSAALSVAEDCNVEPIPVRTNIRCLDPNGYFFTYKSHSAYLCAIAALFSTQFHKVYIASSKDVAHLEPWGSHPLLDPYYTSAHFQIEHHGVEMTRLEKTSVVSDWPIGLQNIRVCQNDDSGTTNCGTCEKCIRTMTSLTALGKLSSCNSFPTKEIDATLLDTIETYNMLYTNNQVYSYRELIAPLIERGRDDLAKAINRVLDLYQKKRVREKQPIFPS